ncbi:amidohydrolase family protein [Bradyrhizobium diazoefficiens]|uniref:amidohydrolase family protein n=1 Tax=Bradyrhizobium diazoefficiens TaxID=1355477 RepID=UPI00190D2640|nr:amidohydrolase family protein [Bradyrhizobium diazoefficiens]QQO33216.1 amidohydrolase family protein [Bradyrhizobium diazoefficiens]
MRTLFRIAGWSTTLAALAFSALTTANAADDWTISGMVLSPNGIISDGAIAISKQMITAVGPSASIPSSSSAIKVPGIILPGFIDLHDHLTWNVLPRWIPARKFNNRYEWQDTAEYDRALVAPHNIVLADAACETEIYAEIKALAGGATSVLGGLLADVKHPDNAKCVAGLARNLDTASGIPFNMPNPDPKDSVCPTDATIDRTVLDVVENDVFPLELMHGRMDFLLCELKAGTLRGMVVHLSEGAPTDSAAHREYTMLSKEILRQKDLKTGIESAIEREGLILIHGTALRDQDFKGMKESKVGLVWSPRSNDELYGSTVNLAAAHLADIDMAIAPDWSPSGSAGMLQEMGYAARHYGVKSDDLIKMATSTPAKMARISDYVGSLAPNKFADFVVVNVTVDPTKPTALDPVVKATPADIALVVVGGQPIFGDPALLTQLLPTGTAVDQMTVCGATKAIYLGQSEAGLRGWGIADIKKALNAALAKASSSLPDIECD